MKTAPKDGITDLPRFALAGAFQDGFRSPSGPRATSLDVSFVGRLSAGLPDAGRIRSLGPQRVKSAYERFVTSQRAVAIGWSIPSLDAAEGETIFDVLDEHYHHGRELAKAAAGKETK